MIEQWDAEAYAAAVLRLCGLDGVDSPNAAVVAKRLKIGIYWAEPGTLEDKAELTPLEGGGWAIRVRRDLDTPALWFAIAHELGHLFQRKLRLVAPDEESFANQFAAALLLPREPLRFAWRQSRDLEVAIAAFPAVPATCVALRLGEAGLADVFVVEAGQIKHARTNDNTSPDGIVALASRAIRAGRVALPGLHAVRLPDGHKRAAVVIDAA